MKYCDSFANINDAFYHYTIREGSLSNNSDISTIVKQYELYDCLCKVPGAAFQTQEKNVNVWRLLYGDWKINGGRCL